MDKEKKEATELLDKIFSIATLEESKQIVCVLQGIHIAKTLQAGTQPVQPMAT